MEDDLRLLSIQIKKTLGDWLKQVEALNNLLKDMLTNRNGQAAVEKKMKKLKPDKFKLREAEVVPSVLDRALEKAKKKLPAKQQAVAVGLCWRSRISRRPSCTWNMRHSARVAKRAM